MIQYIYICIENNKIKIDLTHYYRLFENDNIYISRYWDRFIINKLNVLMEYEFYNNIYLIPSNYNEYLTMLYGDYMIPIKAVRKCEPSVDLSKEWYIIFMLKLFNITKNNKLYNELHKFFEIYFIKNNHKNKLHMDKKAVPKHLRKKLCINLNF